MSANFLIADTHFSHHGVCKFASCDGTGKLRPWDNIEAMDQALIKNWNSVVREQDVVYHLGDVVMNRKALPIMQQLNGQKILIKGNHDVFPIDEYLKYFKDVRGSTELAGLLLTHIPVHPHSVERWGHNVHGHLHDCKVNDPRYVCVSVEQINYTPILLETLLKQIKEASLA